MKTVFCVLDILIYWYFLGTYDYCTYTFGDFNHIHSLYIPKKSF